MIIEDLILKALPTTVGPPGSSNMYEIKKGIKLRSFRNASWLNNLNDCFVTISVFFYLVSLSIALKHDTPTSILLVPWILRRFNCILMEIPDSIQYNLNFRNIKLPVAICWEMQEKMWLMKTERS